MNCSNKMQFGGKCENSLRLLREFRLSGALDRVALAPGLPRGFMDSVKLPELAGARAHLLLNVAVSEIRR